MGKGKVESIYHKLPNGRDVTVSFDPKTWPSDIDVVGYVPLNAVLRDPKQSRRSYDPKETRQLEDSIRSCGQLDAAKVRMLTKKEKKQLPKGSIAQYFMSGGERRHRAVTVLCVPVFKIIVAEYADELEEVWAGLVDNSCRADLEPLDYAHSLEKAKSLNPGISNTALGAPIGWNPVKVGEYLSLNRLSVRGKDLLTKKELATQVAVALSKVKSGDRHVTDHALQEEVIELILENDWSADRQIVEIKKYAQIAGVYGTGARNIVRDPRKNRRLLETSLWTAAQKTDILLDLSEEERVGMFQNVSPEERQDILQAMWDRVEVILNLAEAMQVAAAKASAKKVTSGMMVAAMLPGWIAVDYFDEHNLTVDGTAVSPQKFRFLFQRGRIVGQEGPNGKLPSGLPTPDEVDRMAVEGKENFNISPRELGA